MLPVLLAGAGLYVWHRCRQKSRRPAPAPALLKTHGALMGAEFNPQKLEQAAEHFASQGLHSQARDLSAKASQVRDQVRAIPDLCKRSRALDENAMAMIASVRDEAQKGNPRAKFSAHLIERWCLANPPAQLGPHGEPAEQAA